MRPRRDLELIDRSLPSATFAGTAFWPLCGQDAAGNTAEPALQKKAQTRLVGRLSLAALCRGTSPSSWTATAAGRRQRGLPRTAGHAAGAETFRRIATYCKNLGVEYLTVYAFSTENWKRSAGRGRGHHGACLKNICTRPSTTMERDQIRLKILGEHRPHQPGAAARSSPARTSSPRTIDGFQANICINYGGRDEIVRAARRFAARLRGRELQTPGGADGGRFLASISTRRAFPTRS